MNAPKRLRTEGFEPTFAPGSHGFGAPAAANNVYTDSSGIIMELARLLEKIPPSGGAVAPGPMSGEITVFLVSFGKFRLVTRGHAELWSELVGAARDILTAKQLGGRVNVCIEISSYDTEVDCPADGGMDFLDSEGDKKVSEILANTVKAKKVFCERYVSKDKRIQDISTTLESLLVDNGLHGNPNLSVSVTASPFNIINPSFSPPTCGPLRAACDKPGQGPKCLVVFVGGSDRIAASGKDTLVGKFMAKLPIPHGFLRVGGDRKAVAGDRIAILLHLVEWAIGSAPPTKLKIPMAAFSSSFIDYAIDMCLWACVPKPAIERLVEATTIHSDPASIVGTKAMQLATRVHNVVELHRHATILSGRLAPIQPGMTKKEAGETARTNKARAEAYSTPPAAEAAGGAGATGGAGAAGGAEATGGAGATGGAEATGTDVMRHMSYKMVLDSLMLHGLATASGSPPVYRQFAGRAPSPDDFERLLSWSTSQWWRGKREREIEKEATANIIVIGKIAQTLEAREVPASCAWWDGRLAGGLAGGRRITRKRKRRRPRYSVSGTRRRRGKASRITRRKIRRANTLRKR